MSLKTTEEWCQHYEDTDLVFAEMVPLIQANALRHAAEVCRISGRIHSNPGFVDCHERDAEKLEAEAERLMNENR